MSLSADCYACMFTVSDANYRCLSLSANPECYSFIIMFTWAVLIELSTLNQSQVMVVDENMKTSAFAYLTESR